jgi:hypothetical protein
MTMMSEDEVTDRADIIASSKDKTIVVSHKKLQMIQIKVVFWSARGGECCVVYVALQAHCGTPQWRGSRRGEIGAYVAPAVHSCCSITCH